MSNSGLWNVNPIRRDQVYGNGVPTRPGPWAVAVFGSARITENNLRDITGNPFNDEEEDVD